MSLRLKITIALLVSSLIAAASVGLIARNMVTRHFSDAMIEGAFQRFREDIVAFYQTYGSWQEAVRREHFSAFVQRRRGVSGVDSRTPLQLHTLKTTLVDEQPVPLPTAPDKVSEPRQRPPDITPPVRFILVDTQGVIMHPVSRAGEQLSDWQETAFEVPLDDQVTAYALPEGEPQLNPLERAYLHALNIAFAYAAGITLPLILIIGLFWGYQLTRPLHRLTNALHAMRDGQLKQRVEIRKRDEIGELAASFNQTSERLTQAYEELKNAKQSAEAANHAKSVFLSNMSHELRTPLNAVIGFARLGRRVADLPTEAAKHLGIIQKSGEHLLQLINNVLSMSKIEAGKLQVSCQIFDVRGMLHDIQAMFALNAANKGLRFDLTIEQEVPQYIFSDEGKIRQILINLLGNALKFTEQGGIGMHVDFRSPDQLRIEVIDTGTGIAEHELPKLFRPFEQTYSGMQQTFGTGLGLALCKRFVELLGGVIDVRSTPGHGSSFFFHIQVGVVSTAPKKTAAKRVVGLQANSPQPCILVVDDSQDNRQLVAELMQSVGFEIHTAASGYEAIEQWRQWHPALIWMDWRMPEMDGAEAARRIQAEAQVAEQKVVIIALTASIFELDETAVRTMGFDDVLRKPFKEETLFELIEKHLQVQYRYDESESEQESVSNTEKQKEMLAGLPSAWRTALASASQEADYFAIQQLIDDLDAAYQPLAEQLKILLDQYDYASLQRLVSAA